MKDCYVILVRLGVVFYNFVIYFYLKKKKGIVIWFFKIFIYVGFSLFFRVYM